jgi:hypothetical protein
MKQRNATETEPSWKNQHVKQTSQATMRQECEEDVLRYHLNPITIPPAHTHTMNGELASTRLMLVVVAWIFHEKIMTP